MKRRYRWLAVATACLIAVGIAVAVLAALTTVRPGDVGRLQGTWVGKDRRLTFRGDIADLSGDTRRYYYRLDPSASPSRMVIFDVNAPGVNQPAVLLGFPLNQRSAGRADSETHCLYELRGDRLRIYLPWPGAGLPTTFDPAAGEVLEFQRE